ncbi:MAG: hypothetical protein R2828_32845 [Saprospiraceae bacterium]
MIEIFETWYRTLSEDQKKQLLDYIFNNKIKTINEGFFAGNIGKLERGLFSGPISSSQRVCPTCGKLK